MVFFPWSLTSGQSIVRSDSLKLSIQSWFPKSKKQPLRFIYTPRVDYTAAAGLTLSLNRREASGSNNLSLNQVFRYQCIVSRAGKFTLTNTCFHRLGFRIFFDSITEISFDENSLNTRLDVKLYRKISIAAESEIATRLFNRFCMIPSDTGHATRFLEAGFLTPMTWNLSTGLTLPLKDFGYVLFGISGAKLTVIRDQRVFANPGVVTFYGITPGHNHLFEYGMTMKMMIDQRFLKICRWYCDLLLFKPFHQQADMHLKSLFEVRISRYWVLSVQTRIIYEHEACPYIQLENLASFGFSFRL
jgi:hypothetical protein